MGWLAIVGAIITLALEILRLINETRQEKKEEAVELKKQKTEILQSLARGIVDGDASRINSCYEQLRRLRENK